ncbi:BPG-independent [Mycena epipterygia]|nr:BPG-independent [Mycena epipterygia]
MPEVKDKVCLIVHDGWGVATEPGLDGNAIEAGSGPQRTLAAHGISVGLSEGLMGNSEVGHLNGAGRIVWQDIVRIDVSIKKREFHKNKNILESFKRAKEGNGRLHFISLISDDGVYSHITHLYVLLEAAKEQGVPHVWPRHHATSAPGYCQNLLDFMAKEEYGALATVVGRYYAMDRDKRWERVKIAKNYESDVTDEFLKPIIVNGDEGRVKDDDTLFFFNYRSDRMRELVSVFGFSEKPMEVSVPTGLYITTMSTYNAAFPFTWSATQGVKQTHIAETEKYAHVTFFFNGGVEAQFAPEEQHMMPLPKLATYDLQPEMSVQAVANTVTRVVENQEHDFVMCNFAPPDMVGHTGNFDAAVRAIGATNAAVYTVYAACQRAGYVLLVTADHGNAEQMRNASTGAPHCAHVQPRHKVRYGLKEDADGADEPGALCDVAPTVLDIMGLPQPQEITGRSLLDDRRSTKMKSCTSTRKSPA